jgi:hypothetical protein
MASPPPPAPPAGYQALTYLTRILGDGWADPIPLRLLQCDRCAAVVVESGITDHDAWHEAQVAS